MARYFAEIQNNIVQRVLVADSKEWCEQNIGGVWVETFTDHPVKNYAGVGHTYHPDKDSFSAIKPYPSFILDEKLEWQPPIKRPDDLTGLAWSEKRKNFIPLADVMAESKQIL